LRSSAAVKVEASVAFRVGMPQYAKPRDEKTAVVDLALSRQVAAYDSGSASDRQPIRPVFVAKHQCRPAGRQERWQDYGSRERPVAAE
jgi:hypothetical protein